jgi:ATP-dependent Lon protease
MVGIAVKIVKKVNLLDAKINIFIYTLKSFKVKKPLHPSTTIIATV